MRKDTFLAVAVFLLMALQVKAEDKIGVFRGSNWFLDLNGNGAWDGCVQDGGLDGCVLGFGLPGDRPIAGDWNGDGVAKIGVFRGGNWFLDLNGNGAWDGCVQDGGLDGCILGFGLPGDRPIAGDWNGDGVAKIGVFRGGNWFLDLNGNGRWDSCVQDGGLDGCILGFGLPGDRPIAGDWNGDGVAKIGVFRGGNWFLDLNGNGRWDGCVQDGGLDGCILGFGLPGDQPVAGDWNGDGVDKIGVFRGSNWFLDLNGNGAWDGCVQDGGLDGCLLGFGLPGDLSVTGDWAGTTLVDQGLHALAAGNLRAANERFGQAVASNPSDDRANLYFAITRIAVKVIDDPQLASLASRSGVVITGDSRDVCGLRVTLPKEVPPGAPRTGEILNALRDILSPEIDAAIGNISRLSDTVEIAFGLMNLPSCLRPTTRRLEVEIDRGDALALAAALHTARAVSDILAAYDLDADLKTAIEQPPRVTLASAPDLLTLRSGAALATAREFVDQALANLSSAIESVLAETDDQSNDLLVIVPKDVEDAKRTRRILDLVRQSLQGQVVLPTDVGLRAPERLDLSLFFSARFGTLRPFLPAFDALGNFDLGQFPDPTFGGTAPDLTQQDINDALKLLHVKP